MPRGNNSLDGGTVITVAALGLRTRYRSQPAQEPSPVRAAGVEARTAPPASCVASYPTRWLRSPHRSGAVASASASCLAAAAAVSSRLCFIRRSIRSCRRGLSSGGSRGHHRQRSQVGVVLAPPPLSRRMVELGPVGVHHRKGDIVQKHTAGYYLLVFRRLLCRLGRLHRDCVWEEIDPKHRNCITQQQR